jgi:hypothetical protein
VQKTGPNKLELSPFEHWHSNYNYIILLDIKTVQGVGGNKLAGAGAQLVFRSAPLDTLGSIEGAVEDLTGVPAMTYRLFIKGIAGETIKWITVQNPGKWSTGTILPGRYVCYVHKDVDNNGVIYRGSVYPYKAAEQVVSCPDTITVESRWPVKDINFVFR